MSQRSEEKCNKRGKKKKTHKALAILLISFSASSKKRDATSTTKSGLLSSCSLCNWLNWSSTYPWTQNNKKIIKKKKPSWKLYNISKKKPEPDYARKWILFTVKESSTRWTKPISVDQFTVALVLRKIILTSR